MTRLRASKDDCSFCRPFAPTELSFDCSWKLADIKRFIYFLIIWDDYKAMLINELVSYDQDLALWVEQTVTLLKAKDYAEVDWENLIEELEGLTRSDKRELENHLVTLFEHALKRRYVPLSDCYRGWEATLSRTQKQILRVLRDSPSLNNYVLEIIEECYQDSLKNMRKEYDAVFPDSFPFDQEIGRLLAQEFWQ